MPSRGVVGGAAPHQLPLLPDRGTPDDHTQDCDAVLGALFFSIDNIIAYSSMKHCAMQHAPLAACAKSALQDGGPFIARGAGPGTPRDQQMCQQCDLHVVHDERHLVFECPAMQPVRDCYPALFSPAQGTMQLFMWQQGSCAGGTLHHGLF